MAGARLWAARWWPYRYQVRPSHEQFARRSSLSRAAPKAEAASMTDTGNAVFLSYASESAPAAQRICEALRAAGIEVWFDQSELRGGDAWDHRIREQVRDCALFIPIISEHTQARPEG